MPPAPVSRGQSIQIPPNTTTAQIAVVPIQGQVTKATVWVKDGAGNNIKRLCDLDSSHLKQQNVDWQAPPAAQHYVLYNVGPGGVNVTWL